MKLIQQFVNSEVNASLKACTATLAESRNNGVYFAPIILTLHIVLILFYWVGDLQVTLNLLLPGDPYKST
jgi:hypothetical protein